MGEPIHNDPEVLVKAISEGDRDAEQRLAQQYLPALTFILKSRYGQREFAEDVAQETLLAVLANLRSGKLQKAGALSGYIHSIALNLANQQLREQYRRGVSDPAMLEGLRSDDDLLGNLEDSQLASLLRDTLQDLPAARDRELIRSFYLGDEDKQTLCERFSVSPAHFDRISHRARKRLKALVDNRVRGRLSAVSTTLLVLVGGFL